MATRPVQSILRDLRRDALLSDMTDGQLVRAFVEHADEAAFEAIMQRHGSMVLGVCCRILRNRCDAEDAFQATFLVFARKASSVMPADRVANWLHGVAQRTALKARTMKAKNRSRERDLAQVPEPAIVPHDSWGDLQGVLDEELARLAEIYRLPVLLCDLEGRSIKVAAKQLGWPQGTLASRLVRARRMLAKRLTHRGITLSAGGLATLLTAHAASANVSPALVTSTVHAAVASAAGQALAAGAISAHVVSLTEGVLKTMLLAKWKTAMPLLFLASLLAIGMTGPLDGQPAPTASPPPAKNHEKLKSEEGATKKKSLRVVYAVAEMVVPIAGLDFPENSETEARKTKEEWLIGMIKRTASPSSWEGAGGTGTIQYSADRMSLAVNNTPRVHAQVKHVLETLRRAQEVQVVAETRFLSVNAATFRKLQKLLPRLKEDGSATLNGAETFALVRKAQEDKRTKITQTPKVTFFPGQRIGIAADSSQKIDVKLSGLVASNLHHIDLEVKAAVGEIEFASTARVTDGMTLMQSRRSGDQHMMLLVTPVITLNSEEQQETVAPERATESPRMLPKAKAESPSRP